MEARALRLLPISDASAVGALVAPISVIEASTTCEHVDIMMRRDPDVRCLVVRDRDGRYGVLSRAAFQQTMAGPLGYGRALSARRQVSQLADWSPVVVTHRAQVADVVALVLQREGARLVSDVLVVHSDGLLGHVPVTQLFQTLSDLFAARALIDGLTGLANRDMFLDRLDQLCAQVNAGQGHVAVLYIDLDGFKAINDAYGHSAGDAALRAVAERLRTCFREEDLIARLGGDEFAVVMFLDMPSAAVAAQTAQMLADRTLTELSASMDLRGSVVPGRASLGLAVSATSGADGETLLREADLAMYRVKAAGGKAVDVVQGVQGALALGAPHRRPDRQRLQRAMTAGEFVLHYQPILEVHTGRLGSVEALVRWAHPEQGLLAPDRFLDAVEEAGLSVEFGTYVLRQACAQLTAWRETLGADAPPRINVNLSVRQLLDDTLARTVLQVLAGVGLPPDVLRLELPEVATMIHMEQARLSLTELRAAGVGITLDDLGAGASSLTHLTQVALDGIKIDRQFVAGMLEDDRDMAVVRMLLEMAHAMGLAVTAEGVETTEQLAALKALADGRVCFVQGYLTCRPLPPADLPLPWSAGVSSHEPSRRVHPARCP